MQPVVAGPREGLTDAEVTAVLRDHPDVEVTGGLEQIDMSLEVVEDLTAFLVGGAVQRESYATLHGSCTLDINERLDWGQAIVRPYVLLDGIRFNLGAYFTEVPENEVSTDPGLYSVSGHDILLRLYDRVGFAYGVTAGTNVLAKVEEILLQRGYLKYNIDQDRSDATMPSARVWAIDDNTTWLTVVNDLLGSVGYQGIWSDWDGALQCRPYVAPVDRGPEWVYYGHGETSQLSVERRITTDMFDTPNRWIAVRQNNIDGPTPVEGDGIYTFVNNSTGPTSVDARGGRIITAPLIMVDAADQSALIAAVNARAAADMSSHTTVELEVWPIMPLHWHFDRAYVIDDAMQGISDVLVYSWTLPLPPATDGMRQTWSTVT
jgi:hypothetical protein